jgi:hypothetical protein
MAGRFIKLYEQITSWEWYRQPNTVALFIYLLLKANYKDQSFQGKLVRRGQLITSLQKLATNTGLTIRQTRTALEHLISTGEVTNEANHQYRLITIVKYDEYQSATNETTNKRQTSDKRSDKRTTNEATPSIEYIEQKEDIEKIEPLTRESAKRFTPPTRDEILEFCRENGLTIDADRFLDYYSSNGWKVGKNPMKDWKATVRNWARKDQQERPATAPVQKKQVAAQQYEQRDYGDETMDAMMRMLAMEK